MHFLTLFFKNKCILQGKFYTFCYYVTLHKNIESSFDLKVYESHIGQTAQ